MRNLFLFLTLVFVITSSAQAQTKEWRVESGELRYTLKHMLHTAVGVSKDVKGLGKCASSCSFLVAAPVKSFDSGNSNRDSNMQQFTKAALNPIVELRTSVVPSAGKKNCDVEIKFAGKTHTYAVPLEFTKVGNGFKVHGIVPLKLSDFSIDRPSLLNVSVEDEVPVSADLNLLPH